MTRGTSLNDPRRSRGVGKDVVASHAMPFDPGEGRQAHRPLLSLTVGQVMTRNVRSCRPDDRLATAVRAMCEADCRFLPVVDQVGRPIGVLTDGDICLLGSTDHRPLHDILVREGMSGAPATCRSDDDVSNVLRVMRGRHIRHLPVVDAEGRLAGVVSMTDLVLYAEEKNSPPLRQEIAAALRAIVQKHGDQRIVSHNPFIGD